MNDKKLYEINEKFTEAKLDFDTEHHKNLINNLNKISDDLLRAKWFFLATMGALGAAYLKVYDLNSIEIKKWAFILIGLSGNITFWLLSEYSVSHAFLFRYIQSRMAIIERSFKTEINGNRENIKDPAEKKMFIKNNRLEADYLIPDQFLPIYWASIWMMIINTITVALLIKGSANLDNNKKIDFITYFMTYSLICVPLIWKLWTYYVYKLNKFIKENSKFKIIMCCNSIKNKNRDFFSFPMWEIFLIGIFFIFYFILCKYIFFENATIDNYLMILIILNLFFWPVYIGIIIQFFKIILRLDFHNCRVVRKIFIPEVKKVNSNYLVNQNVVFQILTILYNIV